MNQLYDPEVQNPAGFIGSNVLIKCNVPTFVKDYVSVTSWLQEPSFNIYPSMESGKCEDISIQLVSLHLHTLSILCRPWHTHTLESLQSENFIHKNDACIEFITLKLFDWHSHRTKAWTDISKMYSSERKMRKRKNGNALTFDSSKINLYSETCTKFVQSWRAWWFRHFVHFVFFSVFCLLSFPYLYVYAEHELSLLIKAKKISKKKNKTCRSERKISNLSFSTLLLE